MSGLSSRREDLALRQGEELGGGAGEGSHLQPRELLGPSGES